MYLYSPVCFGKDSLRCRKVLCCGREDVEPLASVPKRGVENISGWLCDSCTGGVMEDRSLVAVSDGALDPTCNGVDKAAIDLGRVGNPILCSVYTKIS